MLQKLYNWVFPPIPESEYLPAVRLKIAYRTLKKLHNAHSLLEINDPYEEGIIYHSMIIGFNLHSSTIIIDAPVPSIPEEYETENFTIHSLLNGTHYGFKSQYYGHNINNHDNCLLELPQKIHKSSRRVDKRLHVTKQYPVKAYFNVPGEKGYFALAENISLNGLKLRLIGNAPDDLRTGSIIRNCRLQFDDNKTLCRHIEIREISKHNEPFKHITIRSKFLMADKLKRSLWEDYLETHTKKAANQKMIG